MLAVIDPYLLHFDDTLGLEPVTERTLAALVEMFYTKGLAIPQDEFYWPRLVDEILRPLAKKMHGNRSYSRHLTALQRMGRPVVLPPLSPGDLLETTGFELMFSDLGEDWVTTMRAVVAGCTLSDETVLVTRLLRGRNAKPSDHEDYAKIFIENLCWELRIDFAGGHVRRVPCVCSRRNMEIGWTRRYSEELPAHEDSARFPFCPPDNWEDPSCRAWQPHQSRPAWRDKFNCYWAEPRAQGATNRSWHWDVYLDRHPERLKKYGANYLNIARWRPDFPSDHKVPPGELHHDPLDLGLKKMSGWEC